MADPIYLIKDGTQVLPMEPKPYDSEDEFQQLLKRFPELLAGEQIDRDDPRRWLLVAREIGVSDGTSTGARWSLDHFFVDQDGIPTLVEVKRQSDTRLRREVVGQVLDYAANAARFWSADYLQQQFDKTCLADDKEPKQVLDAFLASGEFASESFWQVVEKRLRAGEIRLIFLADKVPQELQRVVEFLNEQMTKTEVLAIEVGRYVCEGYATHVPRLIGQTTDAMMAKGSSRAGAQPRWDEVSFFAAASTQPALVQDALRKLGDLAKKPGFAVNWGRGTTFGSLNLIVPAICPRSVVTAQTDGLLKLNFGWLPDTARTALANFAADKLGFESAEGWEGRWPKVDSELWTRAVDDLIEFLRGLR